MNEKILQKLLHGSNSLAELVKTVDSLYASPDPSSNDGLSHGSKTRFDNFIDLHFLSQLEQLSDRPDIGVRVRSDFQSLLVTLRDSEDRLHTATIDRKPCEQYIITDTSIPRSAYQDVVYTSLASAVDAFRSVVASLQDYFRELQRIDAMCWVVDPPRPTFKDDYRRIVLEERAWLHVEVSPEGAARLRVVGGGARAAAWAGRLASGLRARRAAGDVLHDVMCILDIEEFPQPPATAAAADSQPPALECAICLGSELAGERTAYPQPLCANPKCGSYYHAACLFQWLVASAGGAAPRLGVVSGKCPNCLAAISCCELDA